MMMLAMWLTIMVMTLIMLLSNVDDDRHFEMFCDSYSFKL